MIEIIIIVLVCLLRKCFYALSKFNNGMPYRNQTSAIDMCSLHDINTGNGQVYTQLLNMHNEINKYTYFNFVYPSFIKTKGDKSVTFFVGDVQDEYGVHINHLYTGRSV